MHTYSINMAKASDIRLFMPNTKNNKFKLKEYQTEIENNLINKIIEDINIYLSF